MTLWKAAARLVGVRPPTGVTASTAGNLSGHRTEGASASGQPPSRGLARSRACSRPADHVRILDPAARRFTRCMSNSARAWRRSPAMTCRSNIATGILAEHLQTRAKRRAVRRLPHGPGAARRPRSRAPRGASSACAPPTSRRLAPGRQRYTQLLNADGGIIDDLMVTRAPGADGRAEPRRQRVAQGGRFRASARSLARRRPLTALAKPRCSRCRARSRRRRWRASRPARDRRMPFMSARRARFDGLRDASSRAPATPAKTAIEISLPAARREALRRACSREPRSRRSASARAIRCVSKPASASTATNSTRRSTRSRRGSPGRSRSAAASKAAFPAPARIRRRSPRSGAPAGRHPARGPRAGARGRRDRRRRRRADRPRHLRRLRPSVGAPIAMGYVASALRRAWDAGSISWCAASRCAARVVPLPFHPHAYYRG